MHFEIALYRVLHRKSNTATSFEEYLKFSGKNNFCTSILSESWKIKKKPRNRKLTPFGNAI